MSRKHVIPILLGGLLIAGLTACGSNSSSSTPSPSPAAVQRSPDVQAEVVYKQFCISCHGVDLQGFNGPNLQKVGERLTEEQIYTQIQKGSEGMPGFKVSIKEQDIHILAQWLAAKK